MHRALITLLISSLSLSAQNTPAPKPAPPAFQPTPEMIAIQKASEAEHQRELDLLGIKSPLRSPVDNDTTSPHPVNYDESKANVYMKSLPDPLVMNDGTPVTTPDQWWTKRRPQIVELFDREMYGRTPAHLPTVKWELLSTTHDKNGDVAIITKKLLGHVDNSADPDIKIDIELELSTPADAKGPVPVIVELGLSKAILEMFRKRFPNFGQEPGPTWQQQVLARGWGYAEYIPVSVQGDSAAEMTKGIIGLANKGAPRKLDDWSVLKAWAWGVSKCIDYFETDPAVDAKQIGIEGHSRYGKASLVAMAYDPRFAIGFISSSGQSGAKPSRRVYGEQIENQAGSAAFHWVDGNFLKYAGPLTAADLPVDAHELIALVAPRPVFISAGTREAGDGWVDPKGEFLATSAAGPVYRLLGKKDLGTTEFPPTETPLIDGDLAWRQHSGGHTPGPNWPTFLTFASRYLRAPSNTAAPAASSSGAPVHLTAEQDRARLLALLGLKESEMRQPRTPDAKAPNAPNYDESKANIYPEIPDPLHMHNGKIITTESEWWSQRRPEIVADFEREILGAAPANLPPVHWQVLSTTPEKYGEVDAITQRIVGIVDNTNDPEINVTIDLVLTVPAKSPGPVPVILELAFARDYLQALQRPLPAPHQPGTPNEWGIDGRDVLAHGWAFAVMNPAGFQADDGAGLTQGIIGLMNKGQSRGLNDWGTLRAWAWGASRALDYLETDSSVDARQVGIEGHSRFGKAALVTMAYDPRFAICYSSSSGEGGAKLYRHIYGEQMSNLASASLYHWFAGNFLRYGGPLTPDKLPIDNHELIALSAPRPVFIGGGSSTGDGYADKNGDAWADPHGMFLAEVAAGPVYRLLGAKDLGTSTFPPPETALVTGELAFRQHNYGHTPAPNWPAFLDYASHYLHAPQAAPVLAQSNP